MAQPVSHHTVYLVQSAATAWQAAQRIQGATDLPASEAGLAAVRESIGAFDVGRPISLIAAAPDEASRQTAEVIAAAVCPTARIKSVTGLREVNLGLWQGLTRTAFAERQPKVFSQWKTDPWRVAPPEGELLEDAAARLNAALGKLVGKCDAAAARVIVLRPITLALAKAQVTGTDVTTWLDREKTPVVEKFELDPDTTRALRSAQRHKRISA
jgi:probable phosphoglycerate mutase